MSSTDEVRQYWKGERKVKMPTMAGRRQMHYDNRARTLNPMS